VRGFVSILGSKGGEDRVLEERRWSAHLPHRQVTTTLPERRFPFRPGRRSCLCSLRCSASDVTDRSRHRLRSVLQT
jgi:hypothetical protein